MKSAASTLPLPVVHALCREHNKPLPGVPGSPRQSSRRPPAGTSPQPVPRPAATHTPPRGPAAGPRGQAAQPAPVAPSHRTSDDHEDPLDLAALLFDIDRSSLRPAARPRPPHGRTYEPLTRWRQHLFSDVEERAWTSRGINDPDQAFRLLDLGLTPRVLDISVDGQTVSGWLRSGESPGSVVARLRTRGRWEQQA